MKKADMAARVVELENALAVKRAAKARDDDARLAEFLKACMKACDGHVTMLIPVDGRIVTVDALVAETSVDYGPSGMGLPDVRMVLRPQPPWR